VSLHFLNIFIVEELLNQNKLISHYVKVPSNSWINQCERVLISRFAWQP